MFCNASAGLKGTSQNRTSVSGKDTSVWCWSGFLPDWQGCSWGLERNRKEQSFQKILLANTSSYVFLSNHSLSDGSCIRVNVKIITFLINSLCGIGHSLAAVNWVFVSNVFGKGLPLLLLPLLITGNKLLPWHMTTDVSFAGKIILLNL